MNVSPRGLVAALRNNQKVTRYYERPQAQQEDGGRGGSLGQE